MSSNESRIGEAVAALTARLTTWGVEDPHDKAHAYVTDMLRQGWRPAGIRYEPPPERPVRPAPPPPDLLATVRAQLRHRDEETA